MVGADFIGVTFLGDEGTMDVRRVEGGRGGGGGAAFIDDLFVPHTFGYIEEGGEEEGKGGMRQTVSIVGDGYMPTYIYIYVCVYVILSYSLHLLRMTGSRRGAQQVLRAGGHADIWQPRTCREGGREGGREGEREERREGGCQRLF